MNEIEKRMNEACDILMFLDQRIDQRITAQVKYQVEQRLERERENLRCLVSDMIVEERERISALVTKLITELVQTSMTELVQTGMTELVQTGMTELVQTSCDQIFDRFEQMLDRIEAKLNEPMRCSGDDAPPSKH